MTLSRIGNIQHAAYRCRDAEQTRWFYEDVLGLMYAFSLVDDSISGTDVPRRYMHLFFEMGDGNSIAFFDDPDTAHADHFVHKDSFDFHVAFEIEKLGDLQTWKEKIKRAKVKCIGPINHGFVHSIYFYDPNGIPLEITAKDPEYSSITAGMAKQSPAQLKEWTAGTREQKEELFGAPELDRREVPDFYKY